KWVNRHREFGDLGLEDRSATPVHQALSPEPQRQSGSLQPHSHRRVPLWSRMDLRTRALSPLRRRHPDCWNGKQTAVGPPPSRGCPSTGPVGVLGVNLAGGEWAPAEFGWWFAALHAATAAASSRAREMLGSRRVGGSILASSGTVSLGARHPDGEVIVELVGRGLLNHFRGQREPRQPFL